MTEDTHIKLIQVMNLLNSSQKDLLFSVKNDKLVYTIDNITYLCGLDDIKQAMNIGITDEQ
jgi:hypothetical protein